MVSRTMIAKALAIVACSYIMSIKAYGQGSPSQAIDHAMQFCDRLGVQFKKSLAKAESFPLRRTGRVQWVVTQGEIQVTMDDRMRVTTFVDGAEAMKISRMRGVTSGLCSSPAAAWARGNQILSKLEQGSSWKQWKFQSGGTSPGPQSYPGGGVGLVFSYRAHGIDTNGVGNQLSMILNPQSGALAELSVSTGWTYDPPTVQLTESQAVTKAKQILTNLGMSQLSSETPVVKKAYTMAVDGYGCTSAEMLSSQRRIRYAYIITFPKCMVQIDAQTGESLGGRRLKS